jgi:hypothetical protein
MTWESVPDADWATWTFMTATEAYDPSGVEYYFANITDPNDNPPDPNRHSGWQDSTFYQDNGTSPETEYTYTVRARDKSINQNETAPSTPATVTTPPPRPPLALDVVVSVFWEESTTITLNTIDDGLPDPPAARIHIITSLPSHGTLSDPGAGLIETVEYVLVNNGNQVIYTPDSKYLGVDSFSFKADDGGVPPRGGESNEADVLISVVIPEYFTEFFYWNDSDLGNHVLTFVPDGSANFYKLCREETTVFPTSLVGSTFLWLDDDDSIKIDLSGGKQVSIYGQSYSSFWVNSNGNITFDSGDSNPNETFARHFSQKRISGLFDDLDPSSGGVVRYRQYSNRVVVTFRNVHEKGTTNDNSFQIEMFFEGTIALTHLNIKAKDGLAGLSEGNGIPSNFIDSDLSSFFVCADFNRDYRINLGDFGVLVEFWLDNNCSNLIWCEGTDLDRSNQVDLYDLKQFTPYWLERVSLAPPVEAEDGLYSIASQDGRIWDVDGTGGINSGSDSDDASQSALRLGDTLIGGPEFSFRSIVSFDTSYIPDDARVISATLELTRDALSASADNPFDWGGSCLIDIASPHFGDSNELNVEDWGASANAVAIASFPEDTTRYSQMVSTDFNLDGRMNINKYATTQLRVYFSTPTNEDSSTDYIGYYSKDWRHDESYWPKLTVRYITRRPVLKFSSIWDEDGRVDDGGSGIGTYVTWDDSSVEALRLGDYSDGGHYKSILSFDTTTVFEYYGIESILEYYEIDSVVLQMTRSYLRGQNPFGWGGTCFIDVASPYLGPSVGVEAEDWHWAADANSVAYFVKDPGEDKTMVSTEFNAEAISNVNLYGKTQLRVYFTTPALDNGIKDYLGFYPGEYAAFESYKPTLIIRFAPN